MATIQIYGVPSSPFTRATRLAAREKGVDYELVPTRPGETAPLNPLGKMPMMKHGDFTPYDPATAADLFLAPVLFYFPDIPELRAIADSAPNCARWAREMAARPSAVATEPSFKPQIAA